MHRWMVAAALCLAGAAHAQTEAQQDACEAYARTARTLMEARQNGLEMEKAMAPLRNMRPGPTQDSMRELVMLAYEVQRWSGRDMRRRAVEDFGNERYMACIRA
jgi:hypothetical protein